MGVFQKTVFKEFVARQNQDEISLAYQKFQEHFGNPDIQTNILEAKEEQYQEGFLKDLFVNILGYTLFPQENYNLQSEIKNPNDAKKADAAIIFQEKVSAVIELKSTKTPLLKMIEAQAFGYKNQHQNCRYVITSNFRLLGFYLDNAYEFEEFDLFELNLQQFGALYTILHRKNLEKGLPIELKQKSIEREQELTLAFYNDYQGFKDALFLNIAQINKQFDKLLLFEKTQKLLDRVVFMCFAEDKGLLPANLIKTIIAEFENLKELENYVPLYDRFKAHFRYIDQGFKNKYYDIYAYNGGLFAFDEVLDAIKISDEVLESRSQWISRYDFESDIDVNVLGHIFEHSLNELDEKRQELTQEKPINTKRKKDGVFYTPLLITNYMIEESLGKMCQDKQKTLDFEHLDLEKVQNYRNWLLNLRILDPACGSGAFLNQVLTFLLAEHKRVDGLETQISGKIVSSELAHKILENNIFGVDINFESVEITKLSLWLRIAHGKKKLNDLSENIKIGNSLIDDKAVDAKAFDWQKEFPKTVGGFDLIVGNPPYGAFLKPNIKKYLEKNYALVPDFESYYYFISKGLALLKAEGKISMIVPNTFLANHFAQNYRKNLLEKYSILALIDLSELDIFAEANVRNCIFLFKKDKFEVLTKFSTYLSKEKEINTDKYLNESYLSENLANWLTLFTISKEVYAVIKKMRVFSSPIHEFCLVSQGYIPYRRSDLIKKYGVEGNKIVDDRLWHSKKRVSEEYKQEILGRDIQRYFHKERDLYIKYTKEVASYVDPKFFTSPRILIREIAETMLICSYFVEEYYTNSSIISVISNDENISLKYILAILNSKLMGWYHYNTSPKAKKGLFPKILVKDVRNIPIPKITISEQEIFVQKVNQILALNVEIHKVKNDFLELLESNFGKEKFSKKLDKWYELDWNEFSQELVKSKIKLSLKQQKQWKDFFKEEQPKAKFIFDQIQTLENELNQLIYKLYNLSAEEIRIVENG